MQSAKEDTEAWNRVIDLFFEKSYENGNSLYISVPEIDSFDEESQQPLPDYWEKYRGGDFTFVEFWDELNKSLPSDYETEESFMLGFSLPITHYSDWSSLSMYRINDRFLFFQDVPALTQFVSQSYSLNDESSRLTTIFILEHLFEDDLKYMKPFSLEINQDYINIDEAKKFISKYGCYWSNFKTDLQCCEEEDLKKRISGKEIELLRKTGSEEIEESEELKNKLESIRLKCLLA